MGEEKGKGYGSRLSGDEGTDLSHQHDDTDLSDVRRFASHVWSCNYVESSSESIMPYISTTPNFHAPPQLLSVSLPLISFLLSCLFSGAMMASLAMKLIESWASTHGCRELMSERVPEPCARMTGRTYC